MYEGESVSDPVVSDSLWSHGLYLTRVLCPWNSPGKNTGVGCHSLLQGSFLTQGLNQGLLHCRWILDHLSHQGSPFLCISQFKNLNPDPRPYLESFNGSLCPQNQDPLCFSPIYLFNKSTPLDIMRAVQSSGWIYSLWTGMPAQSLRSCILRWVT